MTKLSELAEELLPKCPRCGVEPGHGDEDNKNYFRVLSARIEHKSLFNKQQVLRVMYTCDCLVFRKISKYCIEEAERIKQYLEEEKLRQKSIRDASKW